jgi:hypothetical protein
MRRYVAIALLFFAYNAHAMESLRVGNQLIVVGDSAAKVKEMLGKPTSRSKSSGSGKSGSKKGSGHRKGGVQVQSNDKTKGEKWQYRRDGHTTTFIIADGVVTHIDDVAR